MKIVKIALTKESKMALEELQNNGSGLIRERSFAILHCAAGKKILWIAHALNRRLLTIRTWIDAFERKGVKGLNRAFSPGKPSVRELQLRPRLNEYLTHSPRNYGWGEDVWASTIINA